MNDSRSAFEVFNGGMKKTSSPELQNLYDYEKHYMELVKRYRAEIEFINQLHDEHTQEKFKKNCRLNRLMMIFAQNG